VEHEYISNRRDTAVPVFRADTWRWFASGNMFLNFNVDTDRRSAPATFWAAAVMWR
jgi:hypothetical protein